MQTIVLKQGEPENSFILPISRDWQLDNLFKNLLKINTF
jgi:hypothetical protein